MAFFTAFLKRETNQSRKGVTLTATSAKSQFSHSMMTRMPTMVSISISMASVVDDAND